MSDYRFSDQAASFEALFNRLSSRIRVAMPGNIEGFDPSSQRASVTPGIKMKQIIDGKAEYHDMPKILNAPVVFPFYGQGAATTITVPIKAGDPCLILFFDRSPDFYLQKGQADRPDGAASEDTTTPRCHALTDAVVIPGLITDNHVIPNYSEDSIVIRNKDGDKFIKFHPDEAIEMDDGTAKMKISHGDVTIDQATRVAVKSTGPISLQTPDVITLDGANIKIGADGGGHNRINGHLEVWDYIHALRGEIRALADEVYQKDGVVLGRHVHSGIYRGPDNTDEPVK